jgi:hypothetical protein
MILDYALKGLRSSLSFCAGGRTTCNGSPQATSAGEEITDGGRNLGSMRLQGKVPGVESLLFPIARSLADLVCNEDFTYV